MTKFIWKGLLILILLEIVCRILVDPAYYYQINSYTKNVDGFNFRQVYFPKKIEKYDYLFIGSSKMISSIDVSEIEKISDTIVAINAGRGYSYHAFHYWALKKMIKGNHSILKNAKVIIELNGGMNFTENFEKEKFVLNENQPYMYVPYLNFRLLMDFIKFSDCKPLLKIKLVMLKSISIVRSAPFLFENFQRIGNQYKNSEDLAQGGGLKRDAESVNMIRNMAIVGAKTNIEEQKYLTPFTEDDLDSSIMSKLKDLIVNNGGRIIFLDMPQHSSQTAMYNTPLNIQNRETFRLWAEKNNFKIIYPDNFVFDDNDFPDYFHLSGKRMAEFTTMVMNKIIPAE
jgi:hypothetical protein